MVQPAAQPVVPSAPSPLPIPIAIPPAPPPIAEPLDIPPPPPAPPVDPDPGVVPAIDGAVFVDLNGDGIQQVPDEPGMTDILVALYLIDGSAPGEDALVDQVLTEERGLFYFGFLANGLYRVEVDETPLPLDAARTAPPSNPSPPVEISFEERAPSISFGYRHRCAIEGAVWHDVDANGEVNEDTDHLGVNDVPVQLEQQVGNTTWVVIAEQQTGQQGRQGRFSFSDVEPGNYRVRIDRSVLPAGLRETTPSRIYEFFCDPELGSDAPAGPPLFGFAQEPTAIQLVAFRMERAGGSVRLVWETAVEIENLGFNLYRSVTPYGPRERLNPQLLPARGSSLGGVYDFEIQDPGETGTAWYWLEDVDWDFHSTLHGPLRGSPGIF